MSTPAFNNLLAAARAAFERGAEPGGHFTRLKTAIDAVEREATEPPSIEQALALLIARARREGKVITVETVSDPHAPAMGRYWMRGDVRAARHAPALVPPQSAEDFVRMLLWDEFPERCGKGTTTDHGILGVEHHCCGEPEPALLNDAQIVSSLRERFPAPKASGIVIPPRRRTSPAGESEQLAYQREEIERLRTEKYRQRQALLEAEELIAQRWGYPDDASSRRSVLEKVRGALAVQPDPEPPRPHEVHRCTRCGYLQGHAADCPTTGAAS